MYARLSHLLLLLGLSAAAPLQAQPQAPLEEIVVTAKFRDSQLMRTSGSISVIDPLQLEARGAQHLEDVLSAAPNISWSTGASRSRFLQVRGVGDLEQYAEPKYYPAVGIVVDDLELGSAASAGMLHDIAQVEVLRGPQGTRFGASAHAGMVKLRSHAPTEDFEAHLDAGAGNYGSYRLGGVLSGPLGEGLGARLALQQNRGDGYIDNAYLGRDNSAAFKEFSGRLRLRWDATDNARYDLGLFAFNSDNGYDAWSLDNDRTTRSDQPGRDRQDNLGLTLRGDWQSGADTSVQLLVSHLDSDTLYTYDADWINPGYCVRYTCSYGADRAREEFDRARRQSTVDLRLLGSPGEPQSRWRYVAGVYGNATRERLDYAYPSDWYGLYQSRSDYETTRLALYGELAFDASERLTLAASARLERFDDDYRDSNGVRQGDAQQLFNAELTAEYALSESLFLYATLALAEKPGGTNVAASSQYSFMSPAFQSFMGGKLRFDTETLLSRELGLKARLFDERLNVRATLFHSRRDHAQLENWMWDEAAGLWIGFLDSSSDASAYGLELESRLALGERWELFANLGLLRTEVDSITAFDLDEWQFVDKRDRNQSKSPEYQFNAGLRWRLTEQLEGTLELEGRDEAFFGYYHDGRLDSYELLNASLRWQRGRWQLNLWGRNLTDEYYATHGLYFGADPRDEFGAWANRSYYQAGAPRTYGLDIGYSL